jgi:ribosome-binding factor A
MPMSDRMLQVNEKVQRILARLFSEEIEIPLEYFISIVKVDCAPNLRTADVYISVLPFNRKDDAIKFLIGHRQIIQGVFGKKANLKYTPILKYIIDESEEHADQIYQMMDNL